GGRPGLRRKQAGVVMEADPGHYSVMADEMERYLFGLGDPLPHGAYCDCTAGAGGHARRILSRAGRCQLIAIDRDLDALQRCRAHLSEFGSRVQYFHGGFSRLAQAAKGFLPLAGIVADLGLSRLQLEDASRGFSLRKPGPLDMRFDRRQELRADRLVNQSSERDLADTLYTLADERFSRRVARALVRARPIRDTAHLGQVVAAAVPRRASLRIHPATKTFQALRMAVNDELGEIGKLLAAVPRLLAPGGRFVVLSFHSGEDRLVKQSFRQLATAGMYRLLTRRVVRPTDAEVQRNPASRSARLRAVQRTEMAFSK
ncbi:MAG: 16S rRNA (cytosine(1402)-N(4))-methyltransferase RsmH, partial [Bryobacterales bacterium]|nr:16S rRNA (cytosine(1402)-N(4))-methyltransferase RsmH [Bryobacterales bacterium]